MRKVKSDNEAMKFLYKIYKAGDHGKFQINCNFEGVTVSIKTTDKKFSKGGEYKKKYSAKTVWEAVNLHIRNIK